MIDLNSSVNKPVTDAILRTLGADPDNPPPPPTKIDIEADLVPERLRGIHGTVKGNQKHRVSFKVEGLSIEAARAIDALIEAGTVTTREQMIEAMKQLQL